MRDEEGREVKLSTVRSAYFERSPHADRPGALVLVTEDGRTHVVRVPNDRAAEALAKVRAKPAKPARET